MSNFVERLRQWFENLERQDLGGLGERDLGRVATEVGVSVRELHELNRRGPNAASRLPHRLQVVGIDPAKFASEQPEEFRDMQRLCALCAHHGRCGRELSRDPQGSNWESYCPNATTIGAHR